MPPCPCRKGAEPADGSLVAERPARGPVGLLSWWWTS
jgi:hypothetical protein